MSNLYRIFGNRVRDLRKERKLSQEELGERANLHYTHIGLIERGQCNPSLKNIEKIAKGLKVDISELFTNKKEQARNEIVKLLKNKSTKDIEKLSKIVSIIFK